MGQLDQFGKLVFEEETPVATHGAIEWERPIELPLAEVRIDGALLVRDVEAAARLGDPWSRASAEVVVELKMQGDHVDARAFERGLLRRQALQVVRGEAAHPAETARIGLWLVAATRPAWLASATHVRTSELSPGVHRIDPMAFPLVWIASNELPLREDLIPFLVTRTGSPLVEFLRWVAGRRSLPWLARVLRYVPMTHAQQEQIKRWFAPSDDPEQHARDEQLWRMIAEARPDIVERVVNDRARDIAGTMAGTLVAEKLISIIAHACRTADVELTVERRAHLATLSPDALTELLDRIVAERRWPE